MDDIVSANAYSFFRIVTMPKPKLPYYSADGNIS
jgi:hypothetical protein